MSFEIISTLGPASLSEDFIRACASQNQAHFRLNGSHLDEEALHQTLSLLEETLGGEVSSVTLDIQGSKQRLGNLGRVVSLQRGQEIALAIEEEAREGKIPIAGRAVVEAAEVCDELVLNDGSVRLRVEQVTEIGLRATVLVGGELRDGCGIHIQGKSLASAGLTEQQRTQIKIAHDHGVGRLALSYVRCADDLRQLQKDCQHLQYEPRLIAKIERPEAVDHLTEICAACDDIWLCRGDLGSIVPPRDLGRIQDAVITTSSRLGRPVFVAGQVFHHLTSHLDPTRTEVVHLYHLRQAGIPGIVLSDETAVGIDPINAVRKIVSML